MGCPANKAAIASSQPGSTSPAHCAPERERRQDGAFQGHSDKQTRCKSGRGIAGHPPQDQPICPGCQLGVLHESSSVGRSTASSSEWTRSGGVARALCTGFAKPAHAQTNAYFDCSMCVGQNAVVQMGNTQMSTVPGHSRPAMRRTASQPPMYRNPPAKVLGHRRRPPA